MQKWGAPIAAAAALGAGIYYATSRSTVVKAGEAQEKLMPSDSSSLQQLFGAALLGQCDMRDSLLLPSHCEAITIDMME